MNRNHFFFIFALTMVAAMLALSVGIALREVANREIPDIQATRTAEEVALAEAQMMNVITVGGRNIRLSPSDSRRVDFADWSFMMAAPEAAAETADNVAAPQPTPIPTEPVVTPEPTRDLRPVIFMEYVVQPGDSLYSIAERVNSSIELMALHGVSDAQMSPGTRIERLPYANPEYCPGRRAYVVRDKDTVYRISVHFNTTPQLIREINNLNEDYRVDVTQVICIP